jgi:F0F1-type ATP synthase assembly protein I
MPPTKKPSSGPSFKGESPAETRLGWKMAGMGFQMVSEVAAGTLLGWLFDRWRGTGNVGVIVGASAGIIVGLWSLIRNAFKLNRELDAVSPKRERVEIKADEPLEGARWDEDEDKEKNDWDRDRK